jgi:cyclopropane fatty-acyl-phospholipid synthase-like methyltransferase
MTDEYFRIKDKCRQGLLDYLEKAFSLIPRLDNPKILDIGCGTGVPTFWVAENYGGIITAIDTDKNALKWLEKKISGQNLTHQITTLNVSFFNLKSDFDYFDIILAEGFLNVVGFEKGFLRAIELLRKDGYFIIHDEFRDHESKCDFINTNRCRLIDSLFLNENTWWNNYYKQLETGINAIKIKQARVLFKTELKEIERYKLDPTPFKSAYYIVKKL